ncbi:MAG: exo-alpha-sialidase [Christensenellales bacterium]|jgi:predicted neuraminidase
MKANKKIIFEYGKFFPTCHASTILPLENGDILCAYFAGTREKHDDVGIWISRRVGGIWLEPECIAKDEHTPHWNPVLFESGDGIIRLVYKVGAHIPIWQSRSRISEDGGRTWSAPFLYPEPHSACGPVRSKPLLLKNGDMLAPNSVETDEQWLPFIDISRDGGKSFEKLADIPVNIDDENAPEFMSGKGAIQPTLWQSKRGVHAFLRTTAGAIYRSDSFDGGRTWSLARRTEIPNNNSGAETVSDGKNLYMVLNPVSNAVTPSKGVRHPLSIIKFKSLDDDDYEEFLQLERSPTQYEMDEAKQRYKDNAYAGRVEYSYPAAFIRGGKMYVSYTYCRRQIAVWEIEL